MEWNRERIWEWLVQLGNIRAHRSYFSIKLFRSIVSHHRSLYPGEMALS